ncbi:MAG TPA: SusD/RagB family nutrient-binding outer membrane lipoprotein, partial [Rikenellaceae bacterium]|nr:SusD/RagB family nutrient-binding outer membrane lipoprotein [Rikenellaceae bacterium]
TWCGYMAPTLSDGHNAGWDVNDGWHRRMFTVKYEYGMGGYQDFEKEALELNMVNELALAKVLKVATMHQVADYYGPIAYSHFGELTNLYDPLDEVYAQFLSELDESIAILEKVAASGSKLLEDYDLVYGGDTAAWVRFANSLRLRLAMRIRYADAALARTEAEKSIASPFGVIVANSGNAVMSGVGHHPIYEINTNFNDADTQLGASLEVYLNGYNDPRMFKYAKPASDGKLHGVRPGIAPSTWTNYKNTANKVSAPNASIYNICWLNAAEVAFLRAEGALLGWSMGGTAKEFYEEGIKLSFEEWGVEGAASYLANTTAVPAAYKDNVGRAHANAPSTVTIAWNEALSEEKKLEKIGTQKWLALFPNSCEAWAEYRRLHYPVLITPANNFSNGVVNTDQGIRRVPYPVSEQSDNAAGYASGVEALGGNDNAGTRLWWDQKPFNN